MAQAPKFTKEEIEAANQAIAAEKSSKASVEDENFTEEEIAAAQKELGNSPAQQPAAVEPKEYSATEAYLRNAADSATFGFSDEGVGLVEAIKSLPKNLQKPDAINATIAAYKAGKQETLNAINESTAQHPIAAGAGQATGYLVPLGAAAKGATAVAKLGRAAVLGGLRGVGTSEADSIGGMASDAVAGARDMALLQGGVMTGGAVLRGAGGAANIVRAAGKSKEIQRGLVDLLPFGDKINKAAALSRRAKVIMEGNK